MADKSEIFFGSLLLKKGWITQAQLDSALAIRNEYAKKGIKIRLGKILLKKKWITASQIQSILKDQKMHTEQSIIGGCKVIRKIGEGSMGTVYEAQQMRMDRRVALKILKPEYSKDKEFSHRFLQEARLSARLRHPNIITVHDAGSDGGLYFLTMELVQGDPLDEIIERQRILPVRDALEITSRISEALEHANDHQMIHRDVKPGNIILDQRGTPRLCDMGLAHPLNTESHITGVNDFVGTPDYTSPEQAQGEDLDIRSDIYSLGCTFFHMVTGRPPFMDKTAVDVIAKHINSEVPTPEKYRKDIPRGVCDIILKMTEKDRERRYSRPAQVVHDIRRVLKGEKPEFAANMSLFRIRGIFGMNRIQTRIFCAMLIMVIVALTGGMVINWFSGRPKPDPIQEPVTPAEPSPFDKIETGNLTLKKDYKELCGFIRDHKNQPEKLFECVQRINAFNQKYSTEYPHVLTYTNRAKTIALRKIKEISEERYQSRKKQVDSLAAQDKFTQASRAANAPDPFLEKKEFAERIRLLHKDIAYRASDMIQKRIKEIDRKIIHRKQYSKALTRLRVLQNIQVANTQTAADAVTAEIKRVEKLIADQAHMARKKSESEKEQLVIAFSKEITNIINKQGFQAAAGFCTKKISEKGKYSSIRERIEQGWKKKMDRVVHMLKSVAENIENQLKQGKEIHIRYKGIECPVKQVDKTDFLVWHTDKVLNVGVEELDTKVIEEYMNQSGTARFGFALYLYWKGDLVKSLKICTELRNKDFTVQGTAAFCEKIQAELTDRREKEAAVFYQRIKQAFVRKNDPLVLKLIKEFREKYSDTAVYRKFAGKGNTKK